MNSLVDFLLTISRSKKVFIIGGSEIYKEFLRRGLLSGVLATEIKGDFNCDTFFPEIDDTQFRKASAIDECMLYSYVDYVVIPRPQETQYIDLVKEILTTGMPRENRTAINTLSCFGKMMRFSLENQTIPVLTTKKIYWKGVVEELLWFCRGDTNSKHLSEKKVRIWEGNASREFLDSRGLTNNKEGDLGPVYGFQWRHFNADYNTCDDNYDGKGVDQLQNVIDLLKKTPSTRRAIISAWNPCQNDIMALPPCHVSYQFWISSKGLHCALYQRSGDVGLGIPFNIASGSLLTHLISRAVGIDAYEFVHFIADAHIYCNHFNELKRQTLRMPRSFPTLKIRDDAPKEPYNLKSSDIELLNYKPCPTIKMKMVV